VFTDPVGQPLQIEDSKGQLVWFASRVDPYGHIEVHPASQLEYNLRWPGHYYDPETALHYNRYRYYDPGLGRYLQTDPLGYEGSPTNLYGYPANPLTDVDVLGLAHTARGTRSSRRRSGDSDGTEGTSGPRRHHTTGEALDARYGLTAEQRARIRTMRRAAAGDPAAMEAMRYERTRLRRENLGMEPYRDMDAWRADVAAKNTTGNRERGTEVADTVRPGVADHVGRPLTSGDSLPDPENPGRTTKFETDVEGAGRDGETVRVRPDSITTDADGRPDPSGVVHDNKHFSGPGDQVQRETDQLRAERTLAERNGGRHVISLSSDSPDLDASPPRPRPHPDVTSGGSEVVYADPSTGRVTRVWNPDTGRWDPP
jgi:RHS repeat-associated protein